MVFFLSVHRGLNHVCWGRRLQTVYTYVYIYIQSVYFFLNQLNSSPYEELLQNTADFGTECKSFCVFV